MIVFFITACSTKKDKYLNRKFQALNTQYNVLYNGDVSLQEGLTGLKASHVDNFWETLPIERVLKPEEVSETNSKKTDDGIRNPQFDRAEEKAVKGIQRRSMYIGGRERNTQIDEAHLLLGKARYYEQRFVPAAEAFNYVLYKYPDSDKIFEAKIWREKTNIRLENNEIAIQNLNKVLQELKIKNQTFADAHAALAQAYLNINDNANALISMRNAEEFTSNLEEKARYRFILGQIFETMNQKDSAFHYFQKVIDMKRKSPRVYVINAQSRQAAQFDFRTGDTIQFLKNFNELIEDRENRPFLDVLYHRLALYYEDQAHDNQAIFYYNKSLRSVSQDNQMKKTNYRNIAEIHFNNAVYKKAGQYYDSTLTLLKPRTREHRLIQKKRENLEDVIRYEAVAHNNDSILRVVAMTKPSQILYYQDYINALIKKDEERQAKESKENDLNSNEDSDNQDFNAKDNMIQANSKLAAKNAAVAIDMNNLTDVPPPGSGNMTSNFYFYNQTTVSTGKLQFEKVWGKITLKDNWRFSAVPAKVSFGNNEDEADEKENENENENETNNETNKEDKKIDIRYTVDYYIDQLPKDIKEKDSIVKERNFAYYQLGLIYKEKFKEYQLAIQKLELLLDNEPEERLVLPSLYNLFRLYQITGNEKLESMKNMILNQYPDSRYANIINNPDLKSYLTENDPVIIYANLYKLYEKGEDYLLILDLIENAIINFTGEEIVPKLEMLKASAMGRVKGLESYKNSLNFVSLTYPNSSEGKDAEQLLKDQVPKLEALNFDTSQVSSYKFVFEMPSMADKKTKDLWSKLELFVNSGLSDQLKLTHDVYFEEEKLIVLHGIATEADMQKFYTILTEYKDYAIKEPFIMISTEDYKVVQIKKNLSQYKNKAIK